MFVFYVFDIYGYVNDDIIIDGDILFELGWIVFSLLVVELWNLGYWLRFLNCVISVVFYCNFIILMVYINIYGLVVILEVIL